MSKERYQNKRYVGSGSMATVYQAWDSLMDRDVALKEIAEELRGNSDVRDMFLNEARKMAKVQERQVVQVYDVLYENDVPTIVQEFMGGGSLAADIGASRMSVQELINLLVHVLFGLRAIHREGLIHRDMKPDNILRNERGDWKVADFGVAAHGDEETLLFAPNKYAAPEVLNAPETISIRSDLYSVGVMAAELLLGSQVFEEQARKAVVAVSGELPGGKESADAFWQRWVASDATLPPINELEPSVSGEVAQLIAGLMARDPEQRPSDCDVVLAQIKEIQALEKHRMSAPTDPDGKVKARKPQDDEADTKKPRSWLKIGLISLLLLVVLGFGGFLLLGRMAGGGTPVFVEVTPADARLLVGGVEVPAADSAEPASARLIHVHRGTQITLERDGYEAFSAQASRELPQMSIDEAGQMTLTVALQPIALPVTVQSQPAGALFTRSSDGFTAQTPVDTALQNGEAFTLALSGYNPVERVFDPAMPGLTGDAETGYAYAIALQRSFYLDGTTMAIEWLDESWQAVDSLDVTLATGDDNTLEIGMPVHYEVLTDGDGYLTVMHLSSDDYLTLIYPDQVDNQYVVSASEALMIGKELNLKAHKPLGRDWFVFMLTDEPLQIPSIEGVNNLDYWARYYAFGESGSAAERFLVWLVENSADTLRAMRIKPLDIVPGENTP